MLYLECVYSLKKNSAATPTTTKQLENWKQKKYIFFIFSVVFFCWKFGFRISTVFYFIHIPFDAFFVCIFNFAELKLSSRLCVWTIRDKNISFPVLLIFYSILFYSYFVLLFFTLLYVYNTKHSWVFILITLNWNFIKFSENKM